MKIIVDAMGGDNAPMEIVKGAIQAVEEVGAEIILVGNAEAILRCVQELGLQNLPKGLEIANASDVVTMEDDPARAVRDKKDSSMAVMLYKLRDGEADAAVSAGSTGALLSGATLVVKRVRGIRRAALAPILPSRTGGCILIDCGANAECSSEYLQQFAYMGKVLAQSYLGRKDPRIGLLNIGAEDTKGGPLQKETFALLSRDAREGKLNFVGNVEARDVFNGVCDVLVTDGFSGNVMLKAIEGTAIYMGDGLKQVFYKNGLSKLAGALVKGGLKDFKKSMDYTEVGGTVFLGINKPVVKAHGSSNAKAICSAIRQASKLASADLAGELSALLADGAQAEADRV
jgi:glycerol-3-phosphate acyltransferase PlsX